MPAPASLKHDSRRGTAILEVPTAAALVFVPTASRPTGTMPARATAPDLAHTLCSAFGLVLIAAPAHAADPPPATSAPLVVYAALIGFVGVVIGALLSKLLELYIAHRRRQERMRDMVTALYAEIVAGGAAVSKQTKAPAAERLITARRPFGPSDRTDFVFDSLKSDLSILPHEIIFPIVSYYKTAERCNRMVDLLIETAYETLEPPERMRHANDILTLSATQQDDAAKAITALKGYMNKIGIPYPAGSVPVAPVMPRPGNRGMARAASLIVIARMLTRWRSR